MSDGPSTVATEFPDWLIVREQDVLRWMLEREIVAPIEDPADFTRHAHVLIWATALRLRAEGRTVDYLTVRTDLEKRGQLDVVGAVYLHELSRDSVRPSDAAIVSAASEIQTAARHRRIRTMLGRHVVAQTIDLDAVLGELETLRTTASSVVPPLLDDVAVLNVPTPGAIIQGRIFERTLMLIAGPSGIGKTTLALDLALSVPARRRQWLGADVATAGSWVYVAAEGAPAPRIGGWKIAHGYSLEDLLGLHTWSGAINLLDAGAVSAFIAAVKPLQPIGVTIDTFSRCFVGGDENSAKDVGIAVANLDRIRTQLNAVVVVLHHLNKGGTAERGSGALRGAVDTVAYLQQADDLLQLTCDKQRDAEPFAPVNLKLVPAYPGAAVCVVREASEVLDGDELTDAQGKALHALRELFGALGATSAEWEAAVPTMHRATFYRARTVLIDGGYVRHDATAKRFFATSKEAVARCRTPVACGSDRSIAPVAEAVA